MEFPRDMCQRPLLFLNCATGLALGLGVKVTISKPANDTKPGSIVNCEEDSGEL